MAPLTQLLRTCTSCGEKKSLSAFLDLTEGNTSTYSAICASCRGTGIKTTTTLPQEDESATTPSGMRIGGKEKAFTDNLQKRQLQNTAELYKEEIKNKDKLSHKKEENKTLKAKAEKNHRQTYIQNNTPQNFLGKTLSPKENQKEARTKAFLDIISTQETNTLKEENNKKTEINTTVNLTVPLTTPSFSETRYQNPAFLAFKKHLIDQGKGLGGPLPDTPATVINALDETLMQKKTQQNNALSSFKKAEQKSAKPSEKDPLTQTIDQNWGPGSRKR